MNPRPSSYADTGIQGLDFVLQGGLPEGRPTLVRGGPGTGKTVIALTFLCHGIRERGENGVLITFDESPAALVHHAQGFGFAAEEYLRDGRLRILDMRPDQDEVVGQGLELTAVLARIDHALQTTGARRLVLDAVDGLEGAFEGQGSLRRELGRLFDWIREREITSLITTGETEDFTTRFGLEDYVADCVIALRQDMSFRAMTRLLRVVKRRGGPHAGGEFPFLLDEKGIFMVPVSGAVLNARICDERLSTGIPDLDRMLGGEGPYRGSTLLLSGQAGTGKTSIAATLAQAACQQGLKVLFVSFEESVDELVRNQRSIGADLAHHAAAAGDRRLVMEPVRSMEMGLEEHLMRIMRSLDQHRPDMLILDPISSLASRHVGDGAKEMLLRLMYLIKERGITAVATELLGDASHGVSHLDVSSMIDVWIKLRRHEDNGELNRLIQVVKGRGLPISNQVKEFRLCGEGLVIEEPYVGEGGIAYGTARVVRQAEDAQLMEQFEAELEQTQHLRREMDGIHEARERLTRAEHDARAVEVDREIADLERRLANIQRARSTVSRSRK
ncbi:MAG: circadian clock protein KaiC [Ectothiorhodospira sp.]